MKDNFSIQADEYAIYRPRYPQELFDFLLSNTKNNDTAWDCATGNGQVAAELAKHFKNVFATDISEKQLANAIEKENIKYKKEAAEKTFFADNYFDLITVAQALHWFNFEKFYKELIRVAKPGALFAAITYTICKTNDETDNVLRHFYHDLTGPYWDAERKYIDEQYKPALIDLRV